MIEYLKSKSVEIKQSGSENICQCMFCDDNKKHMYINEDKAVFYCHKCGMAGNIFKLYDHFGDQKAFSHSNKPKKYAKPTKKLEEILPQKQAYDFFKQERGFTKETIDYFKLGQQGDWVTIPYFKNGELINIKYRHTKEKKYINEKDCEMWLFNSDNLDFEKPLIITEGEMDTVAAWQIGYKNVTSISLGASGINPDWIDFLENFKKNIYIVFDNDEAGRKGSKKLVERVGIYRCLQVNLPFKDFNDCLLAGKNKTDLDKYFITAKQYKILEVEHYIDGDSLDELIKSVKDDNYGMGLRLKHWDKWNMAFSGIRDSEVTVVSGDTSSGKTTFCLNLAHQLVSQGESVFIASTEMTMVNLKRKITAIQQGKDYNNLTETDICNAAAYYADKKLFLLNKYGTLGLKDLERYINYVCRRYDCKYLFLDHLHFFIDASSDKMVVAIDNFVKTLVQFSKIHKIHIFIVVHPAKLKNDTGYVTMNDLKGSSGIKQEVENVISLRRVKDEEKKDNEGKKVNKVTVEFQKIRNGGISMAVVPFDYDIKTQRYKEITYGN